jgi:hypothetical protein
MANNNGLREDRKAAVEAGLVHYQMVADERDTLAKELAKCKNDIASLKVVTEAQVAQINNMESRVASMQLVRDQAVAERAKYETLFASFQAMLRTFVIPAAPLITEAPHEEGTPDSDSDRYRIGSIGARNDRLARNTPAREGEYE